MSAHTPGPWDQRRHYDTLRDEIGPRGKAVATVWVRAIEGVLTHEQSIALTAEGEANARLIAAAPDMLAVLLELQASAAYWSEYDVPLGIVDRINAAIEKAGVTPEVEE